jgi:hypothetical protein
VIRPPPRWLTMPALAALLAAPAGQSPKVLLLHSSGYADLD